MKALSQTARRFFVQPVIPLPNAISRRQFLHKLLDKALIVASCIGIAVTLFFLLLL